MHTVYLGLGSNQSEPIKQIKNAIELIQKIETSKIIKKSSLYKSLPVGYLDQPDFINQVISIQTSLSPADLLERFQQIEFQLKRVKKITNGPRTIDIDILLFNQEIILTDDLTIPHSRMLERAFVMIPLMEIEPNILIPKISNLKEILGKLDKKTLTKIDGQSV
ncbi:MAG: 2-amino-4-hydroxy-6-hydroxymethyldihydropteridine diphosphokinase [Proteobacteria bacterium]|jgi:2-amino-4-hydroxy-6-hydroxymethyldihydropteridine diphosphokinase|nr:2-amino-4-hydroxy-6-hydroxymethyldihydropteridine diphosphokinase [Pseudomonadota bacterium]MDA1033998.1 2-amino-4-hydroxy-6-hydroxymethyldihydropteridine diphosphokinase [Pseudomonadota bacterium]